MSLPQGEPPTGQQSLVPAPALPSSGPANPLRVSPGVGRLGAYLKDKPVNIDMAVAVALATNRSFAAAVSTLYGAQGRSAEARAALNPTFGLNATVTEFDAATTAAFPTGAGTTNFVLAPQFNPVLSAQASLPIDIVGTLHAATSQAQFGVVAARIDVNRVRNQVVADVKGAFYSALRAQAQVRVANDTLQNTLNRLDAAQKNYAAGVSPRFDVITAQTDVANAQQGVIQARSQLSLSLALLKNTIGVDIRMPLRLSDQGAVETPPGVSLPTVPTPAPAVQGGGESAAVESAAPTSAAAVSRPTTFPGGLSGESQTGITEDTLVLGPSFDAALQEALRTRPEILEAEASLAAARKGIVVARRSSLPGVSVSVGYTYTPNATAFARPNVVAGVLGVSVPVFDGGLTRARVQEARADVALAETARRAAVDQVGVDVQQAYLALLQARDRVQVANVGLAQAREAARLAQVRYNAGVSQQVGVSPILEISNSQTSLTQAETNQVNALYDYNTARAQLDRAIGRYSYVPKEPGYSAPPTSKVTGGTAP